MLIILTAFLVCSILVIFLLSIPSSFSTSKDIVVVIEGGSAVSPKDIGDTKPLYNSTNNTVVVPYLNPLGVEEYNELKERASSGNLSQVRNVTTLELP